MKKQAKMYAYELDMGTKNPKRKFFSLVFIHIFFYLMTLHFVSDEVINMLAIPLKENGISSFKNQKGKIIEYKKTEDHCVYISNVSKFVKYRSPKGSYYGTMQIMQDFDDNVLPTEL